MKTLCFVALSYPRPTTTAGEKGNGQEKPSEEKPTDDLKAYDNILVLKSSIEIADHYHAQAEIRNQNNCNTSINENFRGYSLQEVIQNQLAAINSCIIKKPEPRVIELWTRLSAFAHWTAYRDLTYWMMMDDSSRGSDTVAMVGYATIATLNALKRVGLLHKDSSIKDLGFVLALLGDFLIECFDVAGGLPWISIRCEVCWPYKIVQHAKKNGISLHRISHKKERFVKQYDDETMVKWWNRKPCVDRWGWSTKWRYMLRNHGHDGPTILRGTRRLGGEMFNIERMDEEGKYKYSLDRIHDER